MTDGITREQVIRYRLRAQQLGRPTATLADTAVLDYGVQDTGPDGSHWALAVRGVDVAAMTDQHLALVWTLRGAPHLYRRADLSRIAAAIEPFSADDAAKRIFDASKPLKAAGIDTVDALNHVATTMHSVISKSVDHALVKGEVSGQLSSMLDEPYLRYCRPCQATHIYEMPFRLAALRAGIELDAGTSPPVLRLIPRFKPAATVPRRFDVIRCYLRLLGPATPKTVAAYIDAPVKEVSRRWPADAVPVTVDGEQRWVLEADADALNDAGAPHDGEKPTHLLGPFDMFLQGKDRSLLVPSTDHAKSLWPVLGRPGAVLLEGDIAGTWRPRKSGRALTVNVRLWSKIRAGQRHQIEAASQRLAAFRNTTLHGVVYE
ncbi:MAG: hypothetical protein JWN95_951 [Frankiales bacterium]|nr:hypothetical protein [Frankiales bacterium]